MAQRSATRGCIHCVYARAARPCAQSSVTLLFVTSTCFTTFWPSKGLVGSCSGAVTLIPTLEFTIVLPSIRPFRVLPAMIRPALLRGETPLVLSFSSSACPEPEPVLANRRLSTFTRAFCQAAGEHTGSRVLCLERRHRQEKERKRKRKREREGGRKRGRFPTSGVCWSGRQGCD